MSVRRRVASSMALASLLFAGSASAYCRTYSCDGAACERDLDWCIVGGKALSWPSSCITWSVQEGGSELHGISASRFEGVVQAAFDQWLNADCGNGTNPFISIENAGPVECGKTEYNQDHGNANIFLFRDEEWPPNETGHALALTTLWFNPNTGMIYDVDVEINGTAGPVLVSDATAGVDLQSVLTHEVGHFLGLSHSSDRNAVMRTYYDPGADDLRRLHPDDVAGICSIYTATREVQTSSCDPRHGFASSCGSAVEGGCAVGGARSHGHAPWSILGALVATAALQARRGRRARSERSRA
jgi:hypothetical protein